MLMPQARQGERCLIWLEGEPAGKLEIDLFGDLAGILPHAQYAMMLT
jgi:hypothetical protein